MHVQVQANEHRRVDIQRTRRHPGRGAEPDRLTILSAGRETVVRAKDVAVTVQDVQPLHLAHRLETYTTSTAAAAGV
jgi:hypothetical protein